MIDVHPVKFTRIDGDHCLEFLKEFLIHMLDILTVAILPARGGSKGIPKKNIKRLIDKPLIAHSILDAKESSAIDKIYVSTDDQEIATISDSYGAEVISRPPSLASDTASSEVALNHAISEIEKSGISPDLIVFLQCTSPIRSGLDIDCAIQKLLSEDADSLLSVSPSHRFLWEETDGVAKSMNYDYHSRPRRQDMRPQYMENGSIYIFKPWILKEFGNRLGGKITLFPMSEAAGWEIDSPIDFEVAEFLMKRQVHSYAN